ncbi:toll/interleukin-1 receptor domain-containing protein [Nitrosomonas sp.]|uniref:toll/interleukin-1 receptor domain-containing protein n=1 Tax=Nitrosomonas sp. TaxID=42353 RepID=UPI001DE1EA97|nr:toll/interleukin-1 receptor domain-containing protein [Nitrosomonas sp.]MCB1949395.1 toll/interleukin-1 receptor domain-containing protein [Nitrosomonas sp.]
MQIPSSNSTLCGDSVFISYARADDLKPPFEETTQGWVTFFWHQLRFELINCGAKQAELWLDRYQIEPAEAFTPKIEQALAQASMLIAVFSENWVQSAWCQEEIDWFGKQHADASDRIVPVYKSDLHRELLPVLIRGYQARIGFRFFTSDDTGKIHEFYWRGLKDQDAYFDLVRQIAQFITERLGIAPAKPMASLKPPVSGQGKTVFVAVAASDLKDARQRLVNDLKASGFTVAPEDNALPETSDALEAMLNKALIEAEYAVHLIGENRGITVEGGSEPIVDQQLRLARQAGLPRILWVPRWLPSHTGSPRNPFDVIQRFDGLQQHEEIHHGEVTDLSQWLRQRIQPVSSANDVLNAGSPASFDRICVMSAHEDDDDLAADLANLLQRCGFAVRPRFSDDGSDLESAPALQSGHALILIPWSQAGGGDLDAMLDRLVPAGRIICLRLPGGDEKAKRRFFREKIVLEKLDTLPADRNAVSVLFDALGVFVQPSQSAQAEEKT